MSPKTARSPKDSTANLGFEQELWLAADKLRTNMERRNATCVKDCLAEINAPAHDRMDHAACGSGGVFVECHGLKRLAVAA